jgi:hypothetical protein
LGEKARFPICVREGGISIPLLHFGRPIAASRFPLRKHSSRRLARRGRKTVLLQDQVCTRDEQFAGWFTEASEVFQRNRIKEVISDLVYVFVDCGIQFFREGARCVRLWQWGGALNEELA